jgi:hypothetical protein
MASGVYVVAPSLGAFGVRGGPADTSIQELGVVIERLRGFIESSHEVCCHSCTILRPQKLLYGKGPCLFPDKGPRFHVFLITRRVGPKMVTKRLESIRL